MRFAWLLALLAAAAPSLSHAALLQIIHTNDLHSHLERSGDPSLGGYAAVKATMDGLKLDAQSRGIETLVLDAGDFTEGSQFFLADRGENIWKLMDRMGYDAVALGNHDWQCGTVELDRVFGKIKPSFPVLAANFHYGSGFKNLEKGLLPSAEFTRSGVKVGVLGLTTDEVFYNWLNDRGFVTPPILETFARIEELRRRNDFVIALTHLGLDSDLSLVRKTKGIDLVVGGHSHDALFVPLHEFDRRGYEVPIVQTGAHGQYVGDLLVDLTPGQPVKVLRYRLVPVHADGPKDASIAADVADARKRLETEFGHDWLHEKIGESKVDLEADPHGPTPWTRLIARALRRTGKADVGLEVAEFSGPREPAGPITREQILSLYPHLFERDRGMWTVWTVRTPGFMLKQLLKVAVGSKRKLSVDGVTFDFTPDASGDGSGEVTNIRVNGQKIKPLKIYSIAASEGLIRGATEIFSTLQLLLQRRKDTGVRVWQAIEREIRLQGGVIRE